MTFKKLLAASIFVCIAACADQTDDPGVCGDGVLGAGEACDAPDAAGCDDACHLTADTRWTVTRDGGKAPGYPVDVAVGPDGMIVLRVSGWDGELQDYFGTLIAYDSSGKQLWETSISPAVRESDVPSRVVIGPDGLICVQGGGFECFEADGQLRWEGLSDRFVTAIAFGDGALFSASEGPSGESNPGGAPPTDGRLHRLDPATGEVEWETVLDGNTPITLASTMALVGDTVVAAGNVSAFFPNDGHAFACVEAVDGAPIPCLTGEDVKDATWLAGTPSGDLVVAMTDGEEPAQLRRMSLDGAVLWTVTVPSGPGTVHDLALGPDQWVAVATRLGDPFSGHGALQMVTDAGAPAWDIEFPPEYGGDVAKAAAVAFGPGFLVVAGFEGTTDSETTWIRRIGP